MKKMYTRILACKDADANEKFEANINYFKNDNFA